MTCAGAGYAGWGHHRGNSACIAGSKAKMLRTAGGDAIAVLAEQGPDDRDVARAGPDEGVADHQAAAHMPLGIGEAMGGAVGPEQARLGQGARVPPVGLDLARPRRIHGCEVRVRDDDLVAERLQAAGDPFAVGRGLDHNPGTCPSPQHGVEALRLGPDAPLDDLTALGEDVDLAFPLVHVDANMVHGWPLLTAADGRRDAARRAQLTRGRDPGGP